MARDLTALFLDFDSYFASVEQHVNPSLLGRPVGVAPVVAESSCCIAASYEAKAFGVKTGTNIAQARILCPDITIVPARPELYVQYHHRLMEQFERCIHVEKILSIDEAWAWLPFNWRERAWVEQIAANIKLAIRENVSETITCSIGAGPNQWLAKMASKMRKPNGVFIIEQDDLPDCLHELPLREFHGIGSSMELRLHARGIHTAKDLCASSAQDLRTAWGSVEGEKIWLQLRGRNVPEAETKRGSYGHSHVLPPKFRAPHNAEAVLHKLTQKAVHRLREDGYLSGGLHIYIRYVNKQSWDTTLHFECSDDRLHFSNCISQLWKQRYFPHLPVLQLAVTLSRLEGRNNYTPSLFTQHSQQRAKLNGALDSILAKHGHASITTGDALAAMDKDVAPQRISFGNVPEPDRF